MNAEATAKESQTFPCLSNIGISSNRNWKSKKQSRKRDTTDIKQSSSSTHLYMVQLVSLLPEKIENIHSIKIFALFILESEDFSYKYFPL